MSNAPLGLQCRDLTVTIGERTVLDALALDVPQGDVCAVVGESGSGKTTLLSVLAGFVEPSSGVVSIVGVDARPQGPADRDATMLFQEPRLFPSLSVAENVAFALRVRGESRSTRRRVALDLLEEVGLADRADDEVVGMSGGEQQRVALARALCVAPALLLLDEPFAAVDAPRRRELRQLVRTVLQQRTGAGGSRTTTILVSHDIQDAVRMADTVAVMIDGRIVQHDSVPEVRSRPRDAEVERLVAGDPLP